MAKLPITCSLAISVLIIAAVMGCGVMPPREARTTNFMVTGFSLPVCMTYSGETDVRTKVFDIAMSREAAQAFVERTVMQTVLDVLKQQGRSALLPDSIISNILSQLRVQTSYEPLECKAVAVDAQVKMQMVMELRSDLLA
ncbi:hypothetical protein KIN20_027930 [Parelaphostrongylus tenuis]|uniref:Uncharacterized protein n=1 Tax=Parelaphostrongylus tenuis TaxID=148309 RepID=A0AAD5R065_PARTN|nr:hypothetical protein KIN20_027930 [Parelaphostrongylus tenuis]